MQRWSQHRWNRNTALGLLMSQRLEMSGLVLFFSSVPFTSQTPGKESGTWLLQTESNKPSWWDLTRNSLQIPRLLETAPFSFGLVTSFQRIWNLRGELSNFRGHPLKGIVFFFFPSGYPNVKERLGKIPNFLFLYTWHDVRKYFSEQGLYAIGDLN